MSLAQQLLASPVFNSLPLERQNDMLMKAIIDEHLLKTESPPAAPPPLEPSSIPNLPLDAEIEPTEDGAYIFHIQGMPFKVIPLNSDPNVGISGPVASDAMQVAKETLGGVGDTIKTGAELLLGIVATLLNMGVDIVTLGQSKKTMSITK